MTRADTADPDAAAPAGGAQPALPPAAEIAVAVEAGHRAAMSRSGGRNADYIPCLAAVSPDLCGLAVVTRAGDVFAAGDAEHLFALESISKVVTLTLAMEQVGPGGIREKIGVSPTGLPFNSALALELNRGRPLSPLVNAGAIATVSLTAAASAEERWTRILDFQSRMAGRPVEFSQTLNESEQATNFHNRALAWLLHSAGYSYCDPMEALDVYTRQCSTMVSTIDLATMGATLANHGVNPRTGERVVTAPNVPYVLAEMMMEGLYTFSGDFAYGVGLPGKSGVGGGILAVAPGKLAIAAFSPPLDDAGNSVRGIVAVADVARRLRLNLFAGD